MGAKKPKDPGPSAADVAQVQYSDWRWTDYVSSFRPAEAELVKRSELSAGERARVRGEVAADTATAFAGLDRKTTSAVGQAGQGFGSGAHKMSLAGNVAAQGEATGVGKAAATLGARLQSEGEKFRVAQIGESVATGVQSDLSAAARRQTQVSLQKAQLKAQLQNQKVAAAAAVTGAGIRKFKSWLDEKRENEPIEEIEVEPLVPYHKDLFPKLNDTLAGFGDPSQYPGFKYPPST